VYHDYFDAADGAGLRNPYEPEPPRPDGDRTASRALVLLGLVGAGLVVGAATGAPRHGAAHDAGPQRTSLFLIPGGDEGGAA
jgi:hypothetical protein